MSSLGSWRLDDPVERDSDRSYRRERTLDVTRDLLLRSGYRRLTVDEIARGATIGKGTVYLHWESKDDLVTHVLVRESLGQLRSMLERLRRDPDLVRISRFSREQFIGIVSNPLPRALYLRDQSLIGPVLRSGNSLLAGYLDEAHAANLKYFQILQAGQLIHADCHSGRVLCTLDALARGFLAQSLQAAPDPSSVAAWAGDTMQDVIARAYEPKVPGATVEESWERTVGVFENLATRQAARLDGRG